MIEEEGFLNVNVTKEPEFEEVSSGDEVSQDDDDKDITQVAGSDQPNFFSNEFSPEMIEDIKFLTTHCRFGATVQRKFLEGKYPSQPIYSKDLYAVIQKFIPTSEMLLNDAASMSNWLDNKKNEDSR
ncbi:8963_t:CDS:2, partial [Racocetra fulgida]